MWKEFKQFIMRGNVLDLAVGIVIGAAFTKIVSSLVADILMPPLGLALGKVDFSSLFIDLSGVGYPSLAAAKAAGAATLNYGLFLNALVDFLIVAGAVFMVVKAANSLKSRETAVPAAPLEFSTSEKLLMEIRDQLKGQVREPELPRMGGQRPVESNHSLPS